jgi:hypothetical protein
MSYLLDLETEKIPSFRRHFSFHAATMCGVEEC